MTGLISVLSELGSRREGGAGGLSTTICQGELETIRAEWKGRWLLLSVGAPRAGAPDVAMHIKEQEAGSLIQEAWRGERATPQRRWGKWREGDRRIWGGPGFVLLRCWKVLWQLTILLQQRRMMHLLLGTFVSINILSNQTIDNNWTKCYPKINITSPTSTSYKRFLICSCWLEEHSRLWTLFGDFDSCWWF